VARHFLLNRPAEVADVTPGGPPAAEAGLAMDVVHPLAGNLAHSAAVAQRQQSAGKAEQVRREQALRKDVAARGDHFDHTVESAEEVNPVHDESPDQRRNGQRPPERPPAGDEPEDNAPGIDITV
jgi:hypothetical protein